MRTLVTGATGFTGMALTKRLIRDGEQVRVIVRNREKFKERIEADSDVQIFEGDICDAAFVDKATKNVDVLFHIAAAYRDVRLSKEDYWRVNVEATENLLKSSLKNQVQNFILCSSVGVHGHIQNPPANELSRMNPEDIYQVTKVESEKRVFQYHKKYNLPVSVIRPTAIYGPGDLRLLKLFKLVRNKLTILIGPGTNYYHMVFINDLVDAFIKVAKNENAVGEPFIIGGNEILTLNEILKMIEEIFQKKNIRIHLPVNISLFIASLSEFLFHLLRMNPPIYKRRVNFFVKSRAFDISKAKRILHYQPNVSLYEGLTMTAEWYRENGYLTSE